MPTPLPDSERRRFIEGALKRGIAPERIKADLRRLEGYGEVSTGDLLSGGGPLSVPRPTSPPVTPQEQEEGRIFFTETLPRQAVQIGAGLLTAPATGGMSLIPAMLTEAGVSGGADLLYQAVRKLMDPQREINPEESMKIGASGALAGGAIRGGLETLRRVGGTLARIPGQAMTEVAEQAPAGGRKAYRMIRAAPKGAEGALASEARISAQAARSASLPEAKASLGAVRGDVDTTPILEAIANRFRNAPVNAGEEAANKALNDLASKLPSNMTMQELHDYLTRIRRPIQELLGKEGGNLVAQDLKAIQGATREYRDKLLTQAGQQRGVQAFARSESEIGAIKRFKKLILDQNGELRRSAPNVFRRIEGNEVIMKIIKDYDAAAGTEFAKRAKALALKRQWTPNDYGDAGALTEILSRLEQGKRGLKAGAGRIVAKGITVALPPRGYPSIGGRIYTSAKIAGEEEKRYTTKGKKP